MEEIEYLAEFGQLLFDLRKAKDQREQEALCLLFAERVPESKFLWNAILNPYTTYKVTDIPDSPPPVEPKLYTKTWYGFLQLLNDLTLGVITGHAARASLYHFFRTLSIREKKALVSIIRKKPDCGISTKRINKIFPGLIPEFNVSAAEAWDHALNTGEQLCRRGAIIERKEQGERRIFIRDVKAFLTRTGHEDTHFPLLAEYLYELLAPGTVIDGELIVPGGNEHDVRKFTGTKGATFNPAEVGVQYVVFDVLPAQDWLSQRSTIPQHVRTDWLQSVDFGAWVVKAAQAWRVQSFEEADKIFLDILSEGGEGIVIKDPSAPYAFKRSPCWVKRKREATEDLAILDILPGEAHGKYQYTMGRLVVRRQNGVIINVAPGRMPDTLRHQIWTQKEQFIGKIIEIAYQEETADGSLQHPRFIRLREDKA